MLQNVAMQIHGNIHFVGLIWLIYCIPCVEADNERLNFLRQEIERHDRLYYQEGQQEVSDSEYDNLRRELEKLELASGFTERVAAFGSDLTPDRESQIHHVPMLSLRKANSIDELKTFHQDCIDSLGVDEIEYWIEPKVDGVAISAVYKDGYLTSVLTRGDGNRGNCISEKIVHSGCLPYFLPGNVPSLVELRGEAYIPIDTFHQINATRRELKLPEYSNPRNLAAGTLLSKDQDLIIDRGLRLVFFGYGAWEPAVMEPFSHTDFRDWLLERGLPVLAEAIIVCDENGLVEAVERFQNQCDAWPFAADGLVIKLNSTDQRSILGRGAKGPEWSVAYKFPPETAETVLEAIRWQMGRTGTLTPVAVLKPIMLKGRQISRASLHNVATLRKRNLKAGQRVRVELAGDVIPAVYPVGDYRPVTEKDMTRIPDTCSWCSEKLIQGKGGSSLQCPNGRCPERVKRQLGYFCEVLAMQGISDKVLCAVVDAGMLTCMEEVFRMREGDTGVQNIYLEEAMELLEIGLLQSRKLPLWQRLQSLGLPGIGETRAKKIVGGKAYDLAGLVDRWLG
jgi:DNA ligase (NAD+)